MARLTTEFQTIRSQGGLLPPDLLRRILDAKQKLDGSRPEDYTLAPAERLNEVITQSWNRLSKFWIDFRSSAAKLPPGEPATGLTNDKWTLPLLRELGFGLLPTTVGPEINGRTYPISRFFGPVPIHLVGCGLNLDRRAAGVRGASSSNPHGLVQEFLNRSSGHLWGIVSNGLEFRILRDSQALSRQSFLEFDLEAMFNGEVYSDFVLFWMATHATRFAPREENRPDTCWLECWTKIANEQGTRALLDLRGGVERALACLGEGFTSHPRNVELRDALRSGQLSLSDIHGQLLRIVYRLIFLFVAEDRSIEGHHLLHAIDESPAAEVARQQYASYYSLSRLRDMASRMKGSRHGDLWRQFQLVSNALSGLEPYAAIREQLALPALGSFLWSPTSTTALNSAEITNHDFLDALRNLAFTRQGSALRPVDYKNLGAEELGGVYESLLALTPQISADGARFTFAEFAGNERKTSGSYYTPDSLVQCLLDSALDPVVEQAIKGKSPAEAEKAILALKVCDPAVGSGHFLVGAAHRLARHLALQRSLAQGESEPSPLHYQHALRDVIGRCLYGVDINPMSAELCRVSLWLEALEPGKPLSFLDHHIRVGNSLLGATPALLAKGIPDEAFTPIEGDDKEVCKRFKKLNKEERLGFRRLFAATTEPWERLGDLAACMTHLDDAPDDSIEAVHEKQRMYEAMVRSGGYLDSQFSADAWCAAFVWKKTEEFNYPITEEVFRRIEHNPHAVDSWMHDEIIRLAQQYQFFHWHLAFPDVFQAQSGMITENEQAGWNGGFDCVLGNPPWVRQELLKDAKNLLTQFDSSAGTADLAVYFLERSVQISRLAGRLGMLTPNKWFVAEYGHQLRIFLRSHTRVALLIDFGHSKSLFPDADTFPTAVVVERQLQMVDDQSTFCFVRAHDEDRKERDLKGLVADCSQILPHGLLTSERWQMAELKATSLVEQICQRGTPLATVVGKPLYRGILTGFNKAFVVNESTRKLLISADPKSADLIKPWLSGREIRRWTPERGDEFVVFTRRGVDLALYPAIEEHLSHWKPELTPRKGGAHSPGVGDAPKGRKPGTYKWYEIQDNVAYFEEFSQPKIVFQEIAFHSQFALDTTGLFCNKTVHIIPTSDLYILGVLNSRTSWWLMNHLFPHMKDEALLLQGSMISQFPIPIVSADLKRAIEAMVQSILSGAPSADYRERLRLELELNDLVDEAFGISKAQREYIVANLPVRDPIGVLTGLAYTSSSEQSRHSLPIADPSLAHSWPAVMPTQSQVIPNPLEELTAVVNAAWATPLGVLPENVALFTLIEVMRILGGPVDSERVRLAANLVRSPAIAVAFMEDTKASEWVRAVGQEAQPLPVNVIQISQFQQGSPDLPWAEAVKQLQGSRAIVVESDGKWSAGSRLPTTSKQDWVQGRAAVAVHLLAAIEPAVAERKILTFIRSVEDGTARRAVS